MAEAIRTFDWSAVTTRTPHFGMRVALVLLALATFWAPSFSYTAMRGSMTVVGFAQGTPWLWLIPYLLVIAALASCLSGGNARLLQNRRSIEWACLGLSLVLLAIAAISPFIQKPFERNASVSPGMLLLVTPLIAVLSIAILTRSRRKS